MNFCVTLLTCNDRNTTEKTITSFLENTNIPVEKLDFYVYAQGCTQEYISKLQSITHHKINFHWIVKEENKGLTFALNELNDAVKEYTFVLFLEDDWICLPDDNKEWLNDSLNFLEQNNIVTTLYLRKWSGDAEKNKYGWTRTVEYYIHKNKGNFNYGNKLKSMGNHKTKVGSTTFQYIHEYLYSNNPNIHRNSDYYKAGIFPFIPHEDIKNSFGKWTDSNSSDKITKCWGYSEAYSMEKHLGLLAYYVDDGIFGHYEDFF